jgi:hypothetical protein
MNFKALVFAIVGALVAAFYGFESVLSYQTNGFTAPMLVKVAMCGAGVYFFLRNAALVSKSGTDSNRADAA